MGTPTLDFVVRRGFWPTPHVCRACGSTRDASRGYPNDAWYCAPCVPPELRFPWEAGYAAPASATTPELLAITAVTPPAQADLLSGFART